MDNQCYHIPVVIWFDIDHQACGFHFGVAGRRFVAANLLRIFSRASVVVFVRYLADISFTGEYCFINTLTEDADQAGDLVYRYPVNHWDF